MTRITTGCPRCGRVDLEVDDLTLVVSPLEEHAWYLFDCFGCAELVVKPAPTSVAVALTSVRVRLWTVPAEVLERIGLDDAPPIGLDDLLDLALAMRSDQDLVRFATGALPGGGAEQDTDGGVRDGGATSPSPGVAGSRPAHPNAA